MPQHNGPCACDTRDVGRGAGQSTPKHRAHRRGRRRFWTDERIEEELRDALAGWRGQYFPTVAQLDEIGRRDLRRALETYGGLRHWAGVVGLPLGPGRERGSYGLSEAKRDTLEVIDVLGALPGELRLRALGKARLAAYIRDHAASREQFLRDIGFDADSARKLADISHLLRRDQWTADRIRQELPALLAGLDEWPADSHFIAAGRSDLLGAVRRLGGKRAWAAEMGLPYRRPGRAGFPRD